MSLKNIAENRRLMKGFSAAMAGFALGGAIGKTFSSNNQVDISAELNKPSHTAMMQVQESKEQTLERINQEIIQEARERFGVAESFELNDSRTYKDIRKEALNAAYAVDDSIPINIFYEHDVELQAHKEGYLADAEAAAFKDLYAQHHYDQAEKEGLTDEQAEEKVQAMGFEMTDQEADAYDKHYMNTYKHINKDIQEEIPHYDSVEHTQTFTKRAVDNSFRKMAHGDATFTKLAIDDADTKTTVIFNTNNSIDLDQSSNNFTNLLDTHGHEHQNDLLNDQIEHLDLQHYDVSQQQMYAWVLDHEIGHGLCQDGDDLSADMYANIRAIQRGDAEIVELMKDLRAVNDTTRDNNSGIEFRSHDTAFVAKHALETYTQESLKDATPQDIFKMSEAAMKEMHTKFNKTEYAELSQYLKENKGSGGYDIDELTPLVEKNEAAKTEAFERENIDIVEDLFTTLDGKPELQKRLFGEDGDDMSPPEVQRVYFKEEVLPQLGARADHEDISYYLQSNIRNIHAMQKSPDAYPEGDFPFEDRLAVLEQVSEIYEVKMEITQEQAPEMEVAHDIAHERDM